MSEKSKILKINKDLNDKDSIHINDNFWFDDITGTALLDEEDGDYSVSSVKLIQNPNHYFLKTPLDNSLNIKKSDVSLKRYPTIKTVSYDEEVESKLPREIIDLRRKTERTNQRELEGLLKKINKQQNYKNYNMIDDDYTYNNRGFVKQGSSSYSDKNSLTDVVKQIKGEILSELKNDIGVVNYPNQYQSIDLNMITKEFIDRRKSKIISKRELNKNKKSPTGLVKKYKYSLEDSDISSSSNNISSTESKSFSKTDIFDRAGNTKFETKDFESFKNNETSFTDEFDLSNSNDTTSSDTLTNIFEFENSNSINIANNSKIINETVSDTTERDIFNDDDTVFTSEFNKK